MHVTLKPGEDYDPPKGKRIVRIRNRHRKPVKVLIELAEEPKELIDTNAQNGVNLTVMSAKVR